MKYKYLLFIFLFLAAKPAFAQDDHYVGEIRLFAGGSDSNVPNGWALCDGRLVTIQKYGALYSLIGLQFGGDGRTSFAIPNLNGNMAVGEGQGPGLTNRTLGQTGGSNTVTIDVANLPLHTHSSNLKVSTGEANSTTPGTDKYLAAQNNVFNGNTRSVAAYSTAGAIDISNTIITTTNTGNTTPLNIQQPILVIRYIISLTGEFPQFN